MSFVKPNAIVRDNRADEIKDQELADRTSANLFHIQKQLHAAGSSLENVLAAAAQAHLGLRIQPHLPVKLVEEKAA